MRLRTLHDWEVTTAEARAIQERLRGRVIAADRFREIHRVAGVDVSFDKGAGLAFAAVVILELSSLETVDESTAETPLGFPYVPGYLSFREVPAICAALTSVRVDPDLILCDGQGFAHPRRFGLACHLGLMTDTPCIGVGKSRLIGTHPRVPNTRGRWVGLYDGEERIGAVLRSRKDVKPIYVSVGHRVGLETAVGLVKRCITRYRLPETTRRADRLAAMRKSST